MKASNIFNVYVDDDKKYSALESFLMENKIEYEVKKDEDEKEYNPDFVGKIEKSRNDYKKGLGKEMSLLEFKDLCK